MMREPCKLSLIVAVADNGVIGAGNGIPWKCSTDMKYFRQMTMGKVVIMGRKTWESLGKPLQARPNIVVTRDETYRAEGASVVSSGPEALKKAGSFCPGDKRCEVMIIGGKAIYDEFIMLAECIYFTQVHLSPEGDVFFAQIPELHSMGWREIAREDKAAGERDEADMSFIVLEK